MLTDILSIFSRNADSISDINHALLIDNTVDKGTLRLASIKGECLLLFSCDQPDQWKGLFKCIIDGAKLLPLLHNNERLDFFQSDQQLEIKTSTSDYGIGCLHTSFFPKISYKGFDKCFTVSSTALSNILSRGSFFGDASDFLSYTRHCHLTIREREITIESTNRHYLGKDLLHLPEGSLSDENWVINIHDAGLVSHCLQNLSGKAEVSSNGTHICISVNGFKLFVPLRETKFPSTSDFFATDNPISISVEREALIRSLKRIRPYSDDENPSVDFSISDNLLLLESENTYCQLSAEESILIDSGGFSFSIRLSIPLLLDILCSFKGSSVEIRFNRDTSFVQFYSSSDLLKCILMPILKSKLVSR